MEAIYSERYKEIENENTWTLNVSGDSSVGMTNLPRLPAALSYSSTNADKSWYWSVLTVEWLPL